MSVVICNTGYNICTTLNTGNFMLQRFIAAYLLYPSSSSVCFFRLSSKTFHCPRLNPNLKLKKQSRKDSFLLVSCTKSFTASLRSNGRSMLYWQLLCMERTWNSHSAVKSWRKSVSVAWMCVLCAPFKLSSGSNWYILNYSVCLEELHLIVPVKS